MNLDHLIRMANQIGTFFEAMPDRDQAIRDIANHLQRTWEPRMRAQILGVIDTDAAAGLNPLVYRALRQLATDAAGAAGGA